MEKYAYYKTCVKVIDDLVSELKLKINSPAYTFKHDYSAPFYYLFFDGNYSHLKGEICDILDDIYKITITHVVLQMIGSCPSLDFNNLKYNGRIKNKNEILQELESLSNSIKNEINKEKEAKINEYKKSFILDLIKACKFLQNDITYYSAHENTRTDFIRNLLCFGGYSIKDQTRKGLSINGKESGEIDLLYEDTLLNKETIIESLNLKQKPFNKKSLENHLDKLMNNYDTNGNLINIILVYVTCDDFVNLIKKYEKITKNHNFRYPLIEIKIDSDFNSLENNEIKIFKSSHKRNNQFVYIYHILVNIKSLNK